MMSSTEARIREVTSAVESMRKNGPSAPRFVFDIRRKIRDFFKHPTTKTSLAYFQIARDKYRRWLLVMLIVCPMLLLLVSPMLLLIVPFAIPLVMVLGMGMMVVGMMSAAMMMVMLFVVLMAGFFMPIPFLVGGTFLLLGLGYTFITSKKKQLEERKHKRKNKVQSNSLSLRRSKSDLVLSQLNPETTPEIEKRPQLGSSAAPGFGMVPPEMTKTKTLSDDTIQTGLFWMDLFEIEEQERRAGQEEQANEKQAEHTEQVGQVEQGAANEDSIQTGLLLVDLFEIGQQEEKEQAEAVEQARKEAELEQARKEDAEEQVRKEVEAKEELAKKEVEVEEKEAEVEKREVEVEEKEVEVEQEKNEAKQAKATNKASEDQIQCLSNAADVIQESNISEDVVFAVNTRYEPRRVIGTGRFGVVCCARDRLTGRDVAIKRIADVFLKADLARQAVRETKLLRLLGRHPNVVRLLAVQMPLFDGSNGSDLTASLGGGSEFYLFMDKKEGTLSSLLKSRGGKLPESDVQFLTAQLLCGLEFIHSCSAMHRDIKPENLLVDFRTLSLQIADFGIACVSRNAAATARTSTAASVEDAETQDEMDKLTGYIGTRFYRAPELVVGFKRSYTAAIDVWAAACVIAEMFGCALFHNCTRRNHLMRISKVCALPPLGPALEQMVGTRKSYKAIQQLPKSKPTPMAQLFPEASSEAISLLSDLLHFMPGDRLTAKDALQHSFVVNALRLQEDQRPRLQPKNLAASSEFEYERQELSLSDYTKLIHDEANSFVKA
jgi:serine/threonine protein kinase